MGATSTKLGAGVPLRVIPWAEGQEVRHIESLSGYIRHSYSTAPAARAEICFLPDGTIAFYSGGSQRAPTPPGGYLEAAARFDLANNQVGLRTGGHFRKGLCLPRLGRSTYAGRAVTVWIKETGGGNTRWTPVGHPSGPTTARPTVPSLGMHFFDVSIGKPIWWSGAVWRDAAGTEV